MKTIKYSAPGKIILSGEHSVVYGKPAFVSAVDLRLEVHLSESKDTQVDPKIRRPISYIEDTVIKHLEKKAQVDRKSYTFQLQSDIPVGRGMGSSAAFCVASVGAFLEFYTGKEFEKQIINSLAYQCEKYFHGMPSGVDVSASCFGGLIFYRKEFEFLKHISSLNFKIPKNIQDNLLLIDSGKPVESTAEMVKHVGKRYNDKPKEMEQTFIDIEKCTKRLVVSVVKEDTSMFVDTLAQNQRLIKEIGIVSKETEALLKSLLPFGVGKVTGAGGITKGSGMILFYATDKAHVQAVLSEKNIQYWPFNQDFEGLKRI